MHCSPGVWLDTMGCGLWQLPRSAIVPHCLVDPYISIGSLIQLASPKTFCLLARRRIRVQTNEQNEVVSMEGLLTRILVLLLKYKSLLIFICSNIHNILVLVLFDICEILRSRSRTYSISIPTDFKTKKLVRRYRQSLKSERFSWISEHFSRS